MRSFFLFLLLTALHVAYGQSIESKSTVDKEALLKRSRVQEKLCWITAGTGLGVFTVGLIMYMSEYGNGLPGGTGYNERRSNTGETLMYVGGGLAFVSIPLYVSHRRDEKIAASLSLEGRPARFPQQGGRLSSPVPTLSLRMEFGRR